MGAARPVTIRIPQNWSPRAYQIPLWLALEAGKKRAVGVWHRRAGKDDVCMHWTARSAMLAVGTYWHMLPEAAQARKAIWDAVNPHTGRKRIDEAFPLAIRARTRSQDMFIEFVNGSTWQVLGSDNYDSLVGTPPRGIVFSEYALADPQAWSMLRPILAENGGWALFISTTRGRNHLHRLYEMARANPQDWYADLLTVAATGAIPMERIEQEMRELTGERGAKEAQAIVQQEYYCSWDAHLPGAYYADFVADAERSGRVGLFPYDPAHPVGTAWDLGIGDSTAIWFFQAAGGTKRIIDYYEANGVGLDHYAKQLAARPYVYYDHILPHDANASELGTGKRRIDVLAGLGILGRVLPMGKVDDGIQAVRAMLPTCAFNTHPIPMVDETPAAAVERMARGLDALRQYRREWDDKLKTFKDRPLHDWCFTGDTEVLTRRGTYRIMDLPQTGEVLTPCGWKPYHSPRITRRDATLVAVQFTGGRTVRCTPDHSFETVSGWMCAEHLRRGSLIRSGLTRSRSISMAASIVFGLANGTTRAVARNFIGMCGRLRSGRSPFDATSITETTIQKRIDSGIWSACRRVFMSAILTTEALTQASRKALARLLLRGTGLMPVGCGTSDTPSALRGGQNGSGWKKPARTNAVESHSWRLTGSLGTRSDFAQRYARPLRIEYVERLPETADVWCLTVPGCQRFCLANGAVVHNCSHAADGFRYLSEGYLPPIVRKPKKRDDNYDWRTG